MSIYNLKKALPAVVPVAVTACSVTASAPRQSASMRLNWGGMVEEEVLDASLLVFWCMLAVILIAAAVMMITFIRTRNFMRDALTATARIDDVKPLGRGLVAAAISFPDATGRTVESAVAVPALDHHAGEMIDIVFRRSDPADVRLNSFMSLWIVPLLCGEAVLLTAVVLAALLYAGVARLPV
ncbi:hypothetical protein [Aestuariivirga sp.]|jgi:hypothetical protein|uniref:hypothetical protein n=1 Tax=Aestuariivirga sp. TaxID=2650926 RepID=UPI00378414F4